MRLAFLTAVAVVTLTGSPAMARDGAGYAGIEGGVLFPRNGNYFVNSFRVQSVPTGGGLLGQTVTTTNNSYGNGFVADYKKGADIDAIAGFDFGFVRIEGELGYKRTRNKSFTASSTLLAAVNTAPITGVTASSFALDGKTQVMSAMLNGLLDYDIAPGVRIYGGGGAGRARVKTLGQRDNRWAYQAIAGVSTAITPSIDLGLKYRYFQTARLRYATGALFTSASGASSTSALTESGKFRSHSLLASLIFNFGAPQMPPPPPMAEAPPPPPPPPPPPATQTCADGTVIEATAACPVPPPPPPPPPPPVKGERG